MVLATLLVVLLLPLHVALFGSRVALVHSLFGLALAVSALDALFLFTRTLPFACGYVPIEQPKIVWPAGFASLLLVSYGFARAERWGVQTPDRTISCALVLAAVALAVKTIDRELRAQRPPIDFEGRPALPTQRLGLFEHVTTLD
jgi:hypothetical protein